MGSRAALAIFCLVAIGCGAADINAMPADLGFNDGADMGNIHCALVTVTAETDPKTGKPKLTAPALLTATTSVPGAIGPTWTVSHAGDSQSYTPTPTDSSKMTVQFEASDPGTWTFVVSFASGPCMGMDSVTLGNPNGAKVKYRLRALPPESTNLPLKDTPFTLTGGTSPVVMVTLDVGSPVGGVLQGPSGPTPGEVRFIADNGPDAITTTDSHGGFMLGVLDSGSYQPLLIPTSTALAPHLGAAHQQGKDLDSATFAVGAGELVTGVVTDAAATPQAGVRVVLRSGNLPSGPGQSSASGDFSLHAEPGSYALAFGAQAWPQASVPDISVPDGGTSFTIQYNVARLAVGGTVVADDGTTPIVDARVTITSRPLTAVAAVSVGGVTLPADGHVACVVKTDGNGVLSALPLLPAGTYDLIIEPPAGSSDGLTALTRTVAGPTSWTLAMQKRITLTGRITAPNGSPVAGARITATEAAGLGAAPATTTGNDGRYSLVVDPGAPIDLLVEPGAADKLSGTHLAVSAGSTTADAVLAPGLLVSGMVWKPSGAPLRSVRVQALCEACASSTPIATAISDESGSYRLYLPDPGDAVLDGGVTD